MYRNRSPPSGYGGPPGPSRNPNPSYAPSAAPGQYPGGYAPPASVAPDNYYNDRRTEPDLAADFRRLSMSGGGRGRETAAPTVSYGRSRSLRRKSSPNNDHMSQYNDTQSRYDDIRSQYDDTRSHYDDSRSQYDARSQYNPDSAERHAHRRGPSSGSLDKQSRHQPRGYHYAGPRPTREHQDDRSHAVMMPARNPRMEPRMGLIRRSSSMGARQARHRGSNETLRGPFPNAAPETALVPSRDLGRSRSVSQSVRRPSTQRPIVVGENAVSKAGSTAVRLDVGGRELDIAIKDPKAGKRRGPVIGNLTINHIGKESKTESVAGRSHHPDTASKLSSSSASSDGYSHFARQDFQYRASRNRSASLGNALSARAPQLRIGGPPQPIIPPTPAAGGEYKHTRISRKIVTREALEELGFDYEETGETFTVLKILRPEEIDDLMDFTARIRGKIF